MNIAVLFTCQQIIVRVRKQYIHSCRERALINSSASSNNYLIDVQLKCPFLLMSIRLISQAFNIHTVCIYILPTGKLLNGDSKCWTASRLHDWPDAELSPFYRGQSCPFCHYLCRYTELNLSSYILKCTYKFLVTIMQFFEIEVDIIIYMTNYMIRKNLTHESWISVVLTLLIIDIIILMKTLLIWYVICYI